MPRLFRTSSPQTKIGESGRRRLIAKSQPGVQEGVEKLVDIMSESSDSEVESEEEGPEEPVAVQVEKIPRQIRSRKEHASSRVSTCIAHNRYPSWDSSCGHFVW